METSAAHNPEMGIDHYFNQMPPERRLRAQSVHRLVLSLYPQVQLSLKYKMPTYESENGWMAIANQKSYWSVYTCSPDKIAPYIAAHPKLNHGKGCLRFRKKDEVDVAAMKQVIRHALG